MCANRYIAPFFLIEKKKTKNLWAYMMVWWTNIYHKIWNESSSIKMNKKWRVLLLVSIVFVNSRRGCLLCCFGRASASFKSPSLFFFFLMASFQHGLFHTVPYFRQEECPRLLQFRGPLGSQRRPNGWYKLGPDILYKEQQWKKE